jgi:hypothetical protein
MRRYDGEKRMVCGQDPRATMTRRVALTDGSEGDGHIHGGTIRQITGLGENDALL